METRTRCLPSRPMGHPGIHQVPQAGRVPPRLEEQALRWSWENCSEEPPGQQLSQSRFPGRLCA